jgi:hypothetical protein
MLSLSSSVFSFSNSTVNPCHYLRSLVLTIKMAKSSSNSDPCNRAIQIIKTLPTSQRLTDILTPRGNAPTSSSFVSTSPRCGLGPIFSSYPEDLSLIFPYHSHFASIYQNKSMDWGEWDTFTTSVTWYKPTPSWGAWVARLALSKLDKWKTLGINEAIRASKYEMPINPNLLTSLLCFWSPATNTISFPKGYMTPTVFDVFALLGLRPMGAMAHPLMAVGTGPEEDFLKGVPLGYNDFIEHVKGAGASLVSYKEECMFYLFWICRFLTCTSSKRVINYYMPIARCLVNGIPIDISLFLLGELYRAMFLLSTKPKQSHGGPVWLIQMWAYSYFPSITPELHPTVVPWSYGEAWMHARFPKEKGIPSFPTCFKLFSDSSRRRLPEEFMPFEAKKYGSEDL